MSDFLLSVSLNQLTSIIFLLEKAKKERKEKGKRRNTCVEKKERKNNNELSQHQVKCQSILDLV